jgi:FkbM family methyltransferase
MSLHYNTIEIGTCDFGTECQKASADHRILAVEPMEEYLSRLPDRPLLTKINAAVSDHDGTVSIYYVPQETISARGLPSWMKGTNSIGAPHPTVMRWLQKHGGWEIVETRPCQMMSVPTLLATADVGSCDYLKIDTEGHDCVILRSLLETPLRPKRIRYESNALTPLDVRRETADRLRAEGYSVIRRLTDTEAVLP